MSNEQVRQQNIRAVLSQALKLFVARGVENTSVEMVARKTNLTLRSVQNYFHTKIDLIAAVLNDCYACELEEMNIFFESEQYQGKNGAEQVVAIVAAALDSALQHHKVVFCTAQMQHIISRVPQKDGTQPLTGNWLHVMKFLQSAFEKGALDGSIAQSTETELVDVKTIMLALQGVREQVAYAMCDRTLREILDPRTVVKKYVRQMELMLIAKQDQQRHCRGLNSPSQAGR